VEFSPRRTGVCGWAIRRDCLATFIGGIGLGPEGSKLHPEHSVLSGSGKEEVGKEIRLFKQIDPRRAHHMILGGLK